MTVREMIAANPDRKTGPPESLFTVNHPEEGEVTLCLASFVYGMEPETERLYLDCDVSKEFLDAPSAN